MRYRMDMASKRTEVVSSFPPGWERFENGSGIARLPGGAPLISARPRIELDVYHGNGLLGQVAGINKFPTAWLFSCLMYPN